MYWTDEKLKDLAARALIQFPYPLGPTRRNLITKSRYRPKSQDKVAWRQYHVGLRAYIVLFDTMLTGCRHSAQWLLPYDIEKATRIYKELRHSHYDYNNDIVNDPAWDIRNAERHPEYSPLDIPQDFPTKVVERYKKLEQVPNYVQLTTEDRPPAPVKRLTAEEYYKIKKLEQEAKEKSQNADKV